MKGQTAAIVVIAVIIGIYLLLKMGSKPSTVTIDGATLSGLSAGDSR